MSKTLNLGIDYVIGSQAQKHITVNEAFRRLDIVVQPTVLEKGLNAPPASPSPNDKFLIGDTPSGDWSGHAHTIAAWIDGMWLFMSPKPGWQTYVQNEGKFYLFDGSVWEQTEPDGYQENDNVRLNQVGIGGGTADSTNQLTVNSSAALFNNVGNGVQITLNKLAALDTASFILQTNFSGRAEIGLTGDDNFHFKVSPNGNTFHDALTIDRNSGDIKFPAQKTVRQLIPYGGRWYCYSDNRWVGPLHFLTENHYMNLGSGATPNIDWRAKDLFLKSGTVIKGLKGLYTVSNAQITAIYWKLYFQYGPIDGSWDTTSETIRVELDGGTLNPQDTNLTSFETTFSEYTCPNDGFLMLIIKPAGTISATQYLFLSGHVDAVFHE